MGKIVIAVFKPHAGQEAALLHVIASRLPLLRRLGLATDRVGITMRATNGSIIDVSEWTDEAAIARAHQTPEVLELWRQFEVCCEYKSLDSLDEIGQDFACFEAVTLPDPGAAT